MADILELMETRRGHVRLVFEHHRELPEEQHAEIAAKRRQYQQMSPTRSGAASTGERSVR
jgi:hypothetical protein